MARLKDAIQDIIGRIGAETSIDYVRVWNNQVQLQEEGRIYSFPSPAAFVEVNPPKERLGLGYSGGDITVNVHIVMVEYDAENGNLEENFNVFGFRDEVIEALTYYEADGCSGMMLMDEQPDYAHSNVYHYILSFVCSFIDATGDQTTTQIVKEPPTDLDVTGTIEITI